MTENEKERDIPPRDEETPVPAKVLRPSNRTEVKDHQEVSNRVRKLEDISVAYRRYQMKPRCRTEEEDPSEVSTRMRNLAGSVADLKHQLRLNEFAGKAAGKTRSKR